jgi:hypothetical protein
MTGTEKQIKVASKIKYNVMSLMESKYYPNVPETHKDRWDDMMTELECKDASFWIATCGFESASINRTKEHIACAIKIMRIYN